MKKLFFILLLATIAFAQNVIEITVKGISNQKNDGAQQDRLEAILDAKRQACEKAGLKIESKTTVENFQTVYDLVETKAASVLLPGFQLVEVGYVQDGTYQVVLSGKIKILDEEENISNKEMRYAKSLNDRGKFSECEDILTKYIDSEDKQVPEELKEEAFYYYIKWGYANIDEAVHKFVSYYPESKYVPNLESFAVFVAKPLHVHDQTFKSNAEQWQVVETVHDNFTFTKKINFPADTIIFKNFRGQDQTILVSFSLLSDQQAEPRTAFSLIISYYNGNIIQPHAEEEVKTVVEAFQDYYKGYSNTFSYGGSGQTFGDLKLPNFDVDGDIPVGKGPFEQRLQFEIHQISF
jgi:hypothetical protein